MGIYGFLSAAYQETYSKLTAVENQKGFIQQKIDFYQNDVDRYDEEIKRISSNINSILRHSKLSCGDCLSKAPRYRGVPYLDGRSFCIR